MPFIVLIFNMFLAVRVASLPAQLDGFKIAHLSDLHLGDGNGTDWFAQVVARTNALAPDIIAITGDTIQWRDEDTEEWVRFFDRLYARYGVFLTTGNHDHPCSSRASLIKALDKRAGITRLANSSETVAGGLQVSGIENVHPDRTEQERDELLCSVLDTAEPMLPLILLSHQPVVFDRAVEHGVDLQLSGHTHCGQMFPLELFIPLLYRYSWGLYRRGDAVLHTSCGTGGWGLPLRFLSQKEITLIALRPRGR